MPNFFQAPVRPAAACGQLFEGRNTRIRNIFATFAPYYEYGFYAQHRDPASQARVGTLRTDHGDVPTPIFMPVGTAATVKGLSTATCATRPMPGSSWPTPTTSTCVPACGSSRRRGACTAFRPGRGRCSPTAAASRSSRSPRAANSRRRGAISARTSTDRSTCSPPRASSTPSGRSAPTS